MSDAGDWREGKALPTVQRTVTQEKINQYAEASGDFNPIHLDSSYASQTALQGTVAHGMMILAYVSQMMTAAFGHHWLKTGRLDARFKSPARPGDTVTIFGRIEKINEPRKGWLGLSCGFRCENQNQELLVVGDAGVRVNTKAADEEEP